MTRVQDQLARVLEHSDADEPSGSWTGLACSDHGLTVGADVNTATPASAGTELSWQQAADPVVPWGVGGQLRGAPKLVPAHGRDQVLPGQAAALGRGLVRAPLRAVRRPEPSTAATLLLRPNDRVLRPRAGTTPIRVR